jgi:hypothetical protein
LNKILNVPLWVKQVIYLKLAEEMRNYYCEEFLRTHSQDDIFSTFVPTITFKGKTELSERVCGFDNNTYNFLRCCSEGLSMLEISVNTFLSMEEVAKYYQLCLEQSYIKNPNSPEIYAMAGYISGKFRIGEYFKQKGTIDIDQLRKALLTYEASNDKKFGEILIELGYITEKDLKPILVLKDEAKKRFILDHSAMPKSETTFSDNEQKYQDEIKVLKEENSKLKQKLLQLLKLVKNNAQS